MVLLEARLAREKRHFIVAVALISLGVSGQHKRVSNEGASAVEYMLPGAQLAVFYSSESNAHQ